jgi:hypothetical protein
MPNMVCLLPGTAQAANEHECCKQWPADENRPMPDFHEYCNNVSRSDVVLTGKATDYPELRIATLQYSNSVRLPLIRRGGSAAQTPRSPGPGRDK